MKTTRVTTTTTRAWVRPHRVHRMPAESARVWTQRRRAYATSAVLWLVLTLSSVALSTSAAVTGLAAAAALLSAAVVVKAQVLVRRADLELARSEGSAAH